MGIGPKLEHPGKGELGMPGVIDDDGRGGEDGVKAEPRAETEDVVDIVSVNGGDDALVVDVKEELVVDDEVSSVLQETHGADGLMVDMEVAEDGEGEGSERHGEKFVFEATKVVVVCVCADGSHDGVVDEALRIGVVWTSVHVSRDVGNVERAWMRVLDGGDGGSLALGIELGRVRGVVDWVNAWKDGGKVWFKFEVGLVVRVRVWLRVWDSVTQEVVRGRARLGARGTDRRRGTHEEEEERARGRWKGSGGVGRRGGGGRTGRKMGANLRESDVESESKDESRSICRGMYDCGRKRVDVNVRREGRKVKKGRKEAGTQVEYIEI